LNTNKYGLSVAVGLIGAGIVGGIGFAVRNLMGSTMTSMIIVGTFSIIVAGTGVAFVIRDFGSPKDTVDINVENREKAAGLVKK
jgi:hypothetical protein